jgi:hypothetical protein
MSATTTPIGKGDEVALLAAVDGWRIATTGTVVEIHSTHMVIAITEWLGNEVDRISVPTEHLRLIDPSTGEVAR